ncbi:hypothetical protein AABB24_005166, partial [Solanum stoloniferum]
TPKRPNPKYFLHSLPVSQLAPQHSPPSSSLLTGDNHRRGQQPSVTSVGLSSPLPHTILLLPFPLPSLSFDEKVEYNNNDGFHFSTPTKRPGDIDRATRPATKINNSQRRQQLQD